MVSTSQCQLPDSPSSRYSTTGLKNACPMVMAMPRPQETFSKAHSAGLGRKAAHSADTIERTTQPCPASNAQDMTAGKAEGGKGKELEGGAGQSPGAR
eukprot:CAMPEP_0175902916 /NCGR_PEP_ID=MMETSP0108-20121206/3647_1 /TAXON_ID=195067 ORGANISM="Goniomonas pacifica, Strain CCMP1869" /NCGR_SAMPLE_ID=MMETSP0108 /ASSEMBLY_ACC=CAM_ASM_000204 /LENGTH=97 /DNA_ID=CAMNT_0017224591 /DNA_START=186 /DNA_END=477 /DNA_ORIENTATION=-